MGTLQMITKNEYAEFFVQYNLPVLSMIDCVCLKVDNEVAGFHRRELK